MYGGDVDLYKNIPDKNFTYNLLKTSGVAPNKIKNWNPQTIAGVNVTFLAANATGQPKKASAANNNSIVTMLDYQGAKFFFMGDAEKPVEKFITTNWSPSKLTSNSVILKLGHHGSETSSTQGWIQTIKPTAAVVSSDTRGWGPYQRGMPALSKLNNIEAWSGRIFSTPSLAHDYVTWCDSTSPAYAHYFQKPMLLPTNSAICTTLYELIYDSTFTKYSSTGGSWYFSVNQHGQLGIQCSWK